MSWRSIFSAAAGVGSPLGGSPRSPAPSTSVPEDITEEVALSMLKSNYAALQSSFQALSGISKNDRFSRKTVRRQCNQAIQCMQIITQLVIFGDQNRQVDASRSKRDNAESLPASPVIDFFLESDMLAVWLELCGLELATAPLVSQLLQSLSMLIANCTSEPFVFYVLSRDRLNRLVNDEKWTMRGLDEDLLARYISLLKTLALRLDARTVQFFFDSRRATFPLLTAALRQRAASEVLVRTAVRNLWLAVCRNAADADAQLFIRRVVTPPFFADHARRIHSVVDACDDQVLDELEDMLLFAADASCTSDRAGEVMRDAVVQHWLAPAALAADGRTGPLHLATLALFVSLSPPAPLVELLERCLTCFSQPLLPAHAAVPSSSLDEALEEAADDLRAERERAAADSEEPADEGETSVAVPAPLGEWCGEVATASARGTLALGTLVLQLWKERERNVAAGSSRSAERDSALCQLSRLATDKLIFWLTDGRSSWTNQDSNLTLSPALASSLGMTTRPSLPLLLTATVRAIEVAQTVAVGGAASTWKMAELTTTTTTTRAEGDEGRPSSVDPLSGQQADAHDPQLSSSLFALSSSLSALATTTPLLLEQVLLEREREREAEWRAISAQEPKWILSLLCRREAAGEQQASGGGEVRLAVSMWASLAGLTEVRERPPPPSLSLSTWLSLPVRVALGDPTKGLPGREEGYKVAGTMRPPASSACLSPTLSVTVSTSPSPSLSLTHSHLDVKLVWTKTHLVILRQRSGDSDAAAASSHKEDWIIFGVGDYGHLRLQQAGPPPSLILSPLDLEREDATGRNDHGRDRADDGDSSARRLFLLFHSVSARASARAAVEEGMRRGEEERGEAVRRVVGG